MKIKYYRLACYIYRVFTGDIITVPQILIPGVGWMDSAVLRSENELVVSGASPTQPPY